MTFINFIRLTLSAMKLKKNKLRCLFTSSSKQAFLLQMKPSVVTQCLTRTFEKSQVYLGVKNRFKSTSPPRIRFSVITELICLENDSLDSVAHCFAKHGTEVYKKFYVQFFSNRDVARLSWKCMDLFTNIDSDEKRQ